MRVPLFQNQKCVFHLECNQKEWDENPPHLEAKSPLSPTNKMALHIYTDVLKNLPDLVSSDLPQLKQLSPICSFANIWLGYEKEEKEIPFVLVRPTQNLCLAEFFSLILVKLAIFGSQIDSSNKAE